MEILPIHKELEDYLKKRRLLNKFEKQKIFFENNPFHRSLNTEVLEPRHLRLWSFRLDKQYRAIFIWRERSVVEIIDINNHYK